MTKLNGLFLDDFRRNAKRKLIYLGNL